MRKAGISTPPHFYRFKINILNLELLPIGLFFSDTLGYAETCRFCTDDRCALGLLVCVYFTQFSRSVANSQSVDQELDRILVGCVCRWGLSEASLGAGFTFDKVADDAGIE